MSAATGDREYQRQPSDVVTYGGASGYTYYAGAMVMRDTTGVIRPLVKGVTVATFLGVIADRVDLSGGDLGASARPIDVHKKGEFTLEAQGTGASAHIGKPAYAMDDQTVGVSAAVPYNQVGVITGLKSTSQYRVRITASVDSLSTDS